MAALAPLVQPGEIQVLESGAPTGATKNRLGILVLIGVLVLSFTDWDGIGAIKFVAARAGSRHSPIRAPGTRFG